MGKATRLMVGQTKPAFPDLLTKGPFVLDQVNDLALLLPVHRARHGQHEHPGGKKIDSQGLLMVEPKSFGMKDLDPVEYLPQMAAVADGQAS